MEAYMDTVVVVVIIVDIFSASVCYGHVLREFDFHCYNTLDICRFPFQYCSSARHNQRCLPCSHSVCLEPEPPLQCSYNCTWASLQRDENAASSSVSYGWMVGTVVSGVIILLLLIAIFMLWRRIKAWKTRALKRDIELSESAAEQPLMNRDETSEGSTLDGNAEGDSGDNSSQTRVMSVVPSAPNGPVKPSEPVQDGEHKPYNPVTNFTRMPAEEASTEPTGSARAQPSSSEGQP